ncbi:hypothetical protein PPERSA_09498 [Pseudocohnilembus persalinus]|uniref:Uncharacterized protein n=1 Tax=Pseudocohnilembus persalinus TaxID=266149 RepID=A0A0V0QQX7_PSEPJ|nr:hypothetical protein PPERSA_09498 [Pseudocohnilembus persalinus]|eukprot:KRX04706.1 hypothetical protein PPERSA_09498 [Pseudocohnilembus persalinus]
MDKNFFQEQNQKIRNQNFQKQITENIKNKREKKEYNNQIYNYNSEEETLIPKLNYDINEEFFAQKKKNKDKNQTLKKIQLIKKKSQIRQKEEIPQQINTQRGLLEIYNMQQKFKEHKSQLHQNKSIRIRNTAQISQQETNPNSVQVISKLQKLQLQEEKKPNPRLIMDFFKEQGPEVRLKIREFIGSKDKTEVFENLNEFTECLKMLDKQAKIVSTKMNRAIANKGLEKDLDLENLDVKYTKKAQSLCQ